MALFAQPATGLNGVTDAVESVVGIDEKNAVVRHGRGVCAKGFQFVVEGHHPAMGMRAFHGDPESFARQHVRSSRATTNVSRPARRERAIDALGAAQTELDHWIASGRET